MRLIIIGGGEVGFTLARALEADHEVVVIDHDPQVADRFEPLDVRSFPEAPPARTCSCGPGWPGRSFSWPARVYTGIVLVATSVLSGALLIDGLAGDEAVRHGAFQPLTTIGHASTDFNLWSDQGRMVLFLLMFIGGCAGSAAALCPSR